MSLVLPFLIPLIASVFSLFIRNKKTLFGLNLLASFLIVISSGNLLLQVVEQSELNTVFGNWPLPFGIEFYADNLSALLVTLISVVSFATMVFLVNWPKLKNRSAYFALTQLLIASSIAISLTADLFNLYVWCELMLISVLGILVLGNKRWHTEAAIKYFTISMLGTLLMLAAIGMLYGASGHLNYSALNELMNSADKNGNLSLMSGVMLVALLLKVGAFPLFAWLPAAYHTLPGPLIALAGGLITKLTAYVILRLSDYALDFSLYYEALGWLAVITMISGVLGAAYHWDLRRILAFHIVSQIGFLLLGIALASPTASTATGLFMLHNILVKTNLFLIAALIWMTAGHYDLRNNGGLLKASPVLAIVFLISALSLVGVPPTSGFWGKLMIIHESFKQEYFIWGAAALFTGLLTLYSMSKIWIEAFWRPHPEKASQNLVIPIYPLATLLVITLFIVLMGLIPDPIISFLNNGQNQYWEQ
jgi:multicomponent Na+:H+ antiporter subunit D